MLSCAHTMPFPQVAKNRPTMPGVHHSPPPSVPLPRGGCGMLQRPGLHISCACDKSIPSEHVRGRSPSKNPNPATLR